jgi:hypothetical protein
VIAAISNLAGAPEQAYRKMQCAGASPEQPYAGAYSAVSVSTLDWSQKCTIHWDVKVIFIESKFGEP